MKFFNYLILILCIILVSFLVNLKISQANFCASYATCSGSAANCASNSCVSFPFTCSCSWVCGEPVKNATCVDAAGAPSCPDPPLTCGGGQDCACGGGGGGGEISTPTPTPIGATSCTAGSRTIDSFQANPSDGAVPPTFFTTIQGNISGSDDHVDFSWTLDCGNGTITDHLHDGADSWTNPFSFGTCSYATAGTYAVKITNFTLGGGNATCGPTIVSVTGPSLSVSLAANPGSGPSPHNEVLTATVGGTATGWMSYYFWWNCAYTGTDVGQAYSQCSALNNAPFGTCVETAGVGYMCSYVNTNPKSTVAHSYTVDSTAKVIVQRDSAYPAEARTAITITASPPSVPSVTVVQPNYCASGPSATVNWTYSSPGGFPQTAYQVQIDDTATAWNPPYAVDTGKVLNSGTSYFASGLSFNTAYKARVRVWDSNDLVSNWTESGSWITPKHAYPLVNFSWSPFNPSAGQTVQFTDQTTFYDSGAGHQWAWLFGDGGTSALRNPTHAYAATGSYNVTETAIDGDGYSCSLTKPVGIQRPIPTWKEVSPK